MSKKKIIKKTKSIKKLVTKSPKKKKAFKVKRDPKLPTPIVPQEFINQYEKDREEKLTQLYNGDWLNKNPNKQYANQIDIVTNVARDQRIEKLAKMLEDEVKLSEEDKAAWTAVFTDAAKDPYFKVIAHDGVSIRKLDNVSTTADWKKLEDSSGEDFKKALDDLSTKGISGSINATSVNDAVDKLNKLANKIKNEVKSPSRPMAEVIAKNRQRLDKNIGYLHDDIEENKKNKDLVKQAEQRTQNAMFRRVCGCVGDCLCEWEAKKTGSPIPRISQAEYLANHKDLTSDVLHELENNLTKKDKSVERAQKSIDAFEKSIGEKTAAYHKARREYLTITKVYEEAMEEVFGKV